MYVHYESTETTIEDMYIMSRCKHNVVANSSYSWWGAWLNVNEEKRVVCPDLENHEDFFPEEWERVALA